MENNYYSPMEMAKLNVENACVKANRNFKQLICLSVLAGIYIAIGAACSIIMMGMSVSLDPAISKFLGAIVFCVGIVSVSLGGAELFTGNIMMTMAWCNHKINALHIAKSWTLVWLFNFVGAILVAWLIGDSQIFNEHMKALLTKIVVNKADIAFYPALLRGIECNILVCLGIWLSYSAKDISGKILAVSFPVFVFVIGGFEHCVANMFYFPLAIMFGVDITIMEMMKNLIPVTIGNILGGGILAVFYYFAYLKERRA